MANSRNQLNKASEVVTAALQALGRPIEIQLDEATLHTWMPEAPEVEFHRVDDRRNLYRAFCGDDDLVIQITVLDLPESHRRDQDRALHVRTSQHLSQSLGAELVEASFWHNQNLSGLNFVLRSENEGFSANGISFVVGSKLVHMTTLRHQELEPFQAERRFLNDFSVDFT